MKSSIQPCALCYSDTQDRIQLSEIGWVCEHRFACYRTICKERDDLRIEVGILKERLKLTRSSKRRLQKELNSDEPKGD